MSPTARTLAYLRRQGFVAAPVERWLPQVQKKRDLFGLADVFAFHPRDRVFLLVQATTIPHIDDRLARCKARSELAAWLKAGGVFEVHGWALREGRWTLKRVQVCPGDPEPVVLQAPRPRRSQMGERQRSLFESS